MPTSNNFLVNEDVRLPTKIKRALGDLFAQIELQAARVADGKSSGDKIDRLFEELITLVERKRPDKLDNFKKYMVRPLDTYKYEKRFEAFSKLNLKRPSVSPQQVDLVERHKAALSPFLTEWRDIAPMVPNVINSETIRAFHTLIPQTEYMGLRFYLSSVKCFDETHGCRWWDPEWGEDEIYCGAVAVDENGETSSAGLFKVGDFDDGDVKNYAYPGKILQYFNIHEGGDTFPKIYTIPVALVEHDWGDLPEWFNKFLDVVKDKVTQLLSAAIGAAVGSALGPLGSLIGAAIGWAVGWAINTIKSWLADEVIGTKTIRATINSYSGNWIGSGTSMSNTYTRDYWGECSHYRIYWRAELVA
jgi:hypothetical protein